MMLKSALAVMKRMVAVTLLGALVTTSMVLIPAEPVHAEDDDPPSLSDIVSSVVKPLTDAIQSVVDAIKSVVDTVLSVVNKILGFFSDFITFIIGLDPNDLHSFVVGNLNEEACRNLPAIVNNLGDNLPSFPDLPFISHLIPFDLQLNLPDLVGIDPPNADSEDLFRFKTHTHLPIVTLKGMAKFPYTIPSGIAVASSSFCVEATERHLAMKDDEGKLRNQIHHDLALGGANGEHNANAINQLPATQGGLLEEVRFVVSETIDLFETAGEELEKEAHRQLEKGDAAFADGRFREAYEHYQKAYSAATKT
ncbi:MAG: hypothetical protein ACE5GQ_03845 [Nitrospinales bacterium]